MQDTLKARLGRLHSLEELADKLQVKVEEKEFSDAKIRILKDFYTQDPLAYAIAGEKDSYLTRIQFIEEKYSTFWRRAFAPRKDEIFDQEVLQVLGSINGVGEYRDLFGKDYILPQLFTTLGRRKTIHNYDLLALVPGGIFGLLAAEFAYHTPRCYQTLFTCYEDRTDIIGIASLLALMPLLFSGMVKLIHSDMNYDLKRLRDAAQKTDEFLRQHYV